MSERYPPRRMELAPLIGVLVEEHRTMRLGLQRARSAAEGRDFEGVSRALRELDPVFRQHIADEEAQVLGLLVKALGREGAQAEIQVFRQHRPIYSLMNKVRELASRSSAELEASQVELEELFRTHTEAEETRVFPKAVSLKPGRDPPSAPG